MVIPEVAHSAAGSYLQYFWWNCSRFCSCQKTENSCMQCRVNQSWGQKAGEGGLKYQSLHLQISLQRRPVQQHLRVVLQRGAGWNQTTTDETQQTGCSYLWGHLWSSPPLLCPAGLQKKGRQGSSPGHRQSRPDRGIRGAHSPQPHFRQVANTL